MFSTQPEALDQQPLVTVKDYRPSANDSSSSDGPESTDEDCYQFNDDLFEQCPFGGIPRMSKYGRTYRTRHTNGKWKEKPIITTVETPVKLRCWTINGPDDTYEQNELREIVYMDENLIVRMKDMELIHLQWDQNSFRRGLRARVGKISPLQKSCITPTQPPKLAQPHPRRGVSFALSKSCVTEVSDMLTAEGRLVEEPSDLSDSSSDSADDLNLHFQSSTDGDSSPPFTFCLQSGSEESTEAEPSKAKSGTWNSPDEDVAPPASELHGTESQREQIVDAVLQPTSSNCQRTQSDEHVHFLTRRVEQLMAVTASIQDKITASDIERKQLQAQLQALQTFHRSETDPNSPKGGCAAPNLASDSPAGAKPRRPNSKRKSSLHGEERLRKELMAEKQRTEQVQLENERLLGVILKLKCEMDLEHDLMLKIEKKIAQQGARKQRQRGKYVVKSRSASKDSRKRVENRWRWFFGRSESFKSKNDAT
ncbi:unnamed protein product [Agarophyton chilense]